MIIKTKITSKRQLTKVKRLFNKHWPTSGGICDNDFRNSPYCHLYGVGDKEKYRTCELYPDQFPEYPVVSFADFCYAIEHDRLPVKVTKNILDLTGHKCFKPKNQDELNAIYNEFNRLFPENTKNIKDFIIGYNVHFYVIKGNCDQNALCYYQSQFYEEITFDQLMSYMKAEQEKNMPKVTKKVAPVAEAADYKVKLLRQDDVDVIASIIPEDDGLGYYRPRTCGKNEYFIYYNDKSCHVTDSIPDEAQELTVSQLVYLILKGELPPKQKIVHTLRVKTFDCVVKPGESLKMGCTEFSKEEVENLIALWNKAE